ncbi:MAG TPA: hypothetical protein VK771_06285, partial [Acidimicrobiia bacterium]|nr:hypothetical protein [Acidimicrobiia bacterium]
TGPGTLLWAEAANPGWHALADGRDLARTDAFDWTNAFAVPTTASVAIRYRAGALPGLLVDVEIVAWLAALAIWYQTRRKRRRSDRTVAT